MFRRRLTTRVALHKRAALLHCATRNRSTHQWRQSGLKSGRSWIRVKQIRFLKQFHTKNSISEERIDHLQLLLAKLFISLHKSSLSNTFRTYFLYITRYNISRPAHDPLRPPHVLKSWGRDPATPRIDAPGTH